MFFSKIKLYLKDGIPVRNMEYFVVGRIRPDAENAVHFIKINNLEF